MDEQAHDDQRPVAIDVPWDELSPAARRGVVEAFVLREGTDYGEREYGFEAKVAAVVSRLERGEARLVFEPHSRSVDIVPAARTPAR